jgi:hypothetical protein
MPSPTQQPYVRLRALERPSVGLYPGDLIGRGAACALRLNDPRISEIHAMISLRGGALAMLALRGRLAVEGEERRAVELRAGLTVKAARGISLSVEEVCVPARSLSLELDGQRAPLLRSSYAIFAEAPEARAGYHPAAAAHLWRSDEGWFVVEGGGEPALLAPGEARRVAGRELRLVWAEVASGVSTTVTEPAGQASLRLVLDYDAAVLYRGGRELLALSGNAARLLSALGEAHPSPLHWAELARALWPYQGARPGGDLAVTLRRRFDRSLGLLRRKLHEAGVRPDLVGDAGYGLRRLALRPQDVLEII